MKRTSTGEDPAAAMTTSTDVKPLPAFRKKVSFQEEVKVHRKSNRSQSPV